MFSQGVSEIVFIVSDVIRAAAFYSDVVGLHPMTEATKDWAWFWSGEPATSTRVALHKGPLLFEEHSPSSPGQRWGHVHYAFQVPRSKLMAAVDHVRSNGIEVYGPTRFDWMKAESFYFYDLDGNLLEWWSPDP